MKCAGVNVRLAVAAGEARLPGQQIAVLELRRARVEQHIREARRPFPAAHGVVAGRCGDLRSDAEAHRGIPGVDEIGGEGVQVANPGRRAKVRLHRIAVHRKRRTEDPVGLADRDRLGVPQPELISVLVG